MAMDKTRLGSALWTAVKAVQPTAPPSLTEDAKGLAVWTDVADQIIQEVIANSVVTITTFSATAPGIQTGSGVSGTITGTATGKVTA